MVQTVKLVKGDLLRPDEVANYFSLSVKTIYEWISEGKIEAVRIGPTRVLRITKEAVEKLIQPAVQ